MTPQQIKDNVPEVISYSDAKKQGLDYYFTGKPCMYNQIEKRNIKSRHCLCFICLAKQSYKCRKYHDENRDQRRSTKNESAKRIRIKPRNPTFTKPL